MHESRFLTDQLAILSPIMLALTAGSPIFRGRLVDTDSRWDAISMAVDDRTAAERRPAGAAVDANAEREELAGRGVRRLPKSRYASASHFIYSCPAAKKLHVENPLASLSDLDYEVDQASYDQLIEGGIDEALARHVAYNFSRDPLVLYSGLIDVDDEKSTIHFENIQSTNWNSVRWKPPPSMNSSIGWRTEFRPMEVQMTDFENAAFAVTTLLFTRTLLAFDLEMYLPISKVDENMTRAQRRDAVTREKFFFRKNLVPPAALEAQCCGKTPACGIVDGEIEEMTILEVLHGKGSYFPGLIPLCQVGGGRVGGIERRATLTRVPALSSTGLHGPHLPRLAHAAPSRALPQAHLHARQWPPHDRCGLDAKVCHLPSGVPQRLGSAAVHCARPHGGSP